MDTMAKSGDEVTALAAGSEKRKARRSYTAEHRTQILDEAREPGASVSVVARRHDVNANLVFTWLRQHRQGTLPGTASTLVPVQVADAETSKPAKLERKSARRKLQPIPGSMVEIELVGGHRVRVHGVPDSRVVRMVLDILAR